VELFMGIIYGNLFEKRFPSFCHKVMKKAEKIPKGSSQLIF